MNPFTHSLTITWDGDAWRVESSIPGERIVPDTAIYAEIPPESILPEQKPDETSLLMFPQGSFLYFAPKFSKNLEEAEKIWEQHKAKHRPLLAKSPPRPLIPILLLEDFSLRKYDPLSGAKDVTCQVDGIDHRFGSLNSLASWCYLHYTNVKAGAVGIFTSLLFVHAKELLVIDHKRKEITRGTPLPEVECDDTQRELFPENEF